jgi:hypothetical protein
MVFIGGEVSLRVTTVQTWSLLANITIGPVEWRMYVGVNIYEPDSRSVTHGVRW